MQSKERGAFCTRSFDYPIDFLTFWAYYNTRKICLSFTSNGMHLYAIILAGGSGTRFWPVSRAHFPKQFLVLQGTQSLLQATASRIAPLILPDQIYVVTAAHLQAQTMSQLPEIPAANILTEPIGRNTAAAVGLAASYLMMVDPQAIMVVLPADHAIADSTTFCASLQQAALAVEHANLLMTLGVQPTFPARAMATFKWATPAITAPPSARRHGLLRNPGRGRLVQFLLPNNTCGIVASSRVARCDHRGRTQHAYARTRAQTQRVRHAWRLAPPRRCCMRHTPSFPMCLLILASWKSHHEWESYRCCGPGGCGQGVLLSPTPG
jgi:molybdopterin-guanine dinucleotide biosynthesis protein A